MRPGSAPLKIAVTTDTTERTLWSGGTYGRWIGIISASFGAIGALLSIPGYPFWSLCVFILEVLVIYGLAVYGGHRPDESRVRPAR